MTGKEYQNLAMRTNDHKNSDRIIKKINNNQLVNSDELIIPDIGGVLNGCLGLAGESGEVLDLIKKWVFHENELHVEHLKKELGDVMWYVAMICESMELDIDEIFQMNINKLKVSCLLCSSTDCFNSLIASISLEEEMSALCRSCCNNSF